MQTSSRQKQEAEELTNSETDQTDSKKRTSVGFAGLEWVLKRLASRSATLMGRTLRKRASQAEPEVWKDAQKRATGSEGGRDAAGARGDRSKAGSGTDLCARFCALSRREKESVRCALRDGPCVCHGSTLRVGCAATRCVRSNRVSGFATKSTVNLTLKMLQIVDAGMHA